LGKGGGDGTCDVGAVEAGADEAGAVEGGVEFWTDGFVIQPSPGKFGALTI